MIYCDKTLLVIPNRNAKAERIQIMSYPSLDELPAKAGIHVVFKE